MRSTRVDPSCGAACGTQEATPHISQSRILAPHTTKGAVILSPRIYSKVKNRESSNPIQLTRAATMASNPTFSVEYIATLTTSTKLTPHILVELLADLEASAITTSLTEQTTELISTYYSAFLLALLLVDDV